MFWNVIFLLCYRNMPTIKMYNLLPTSYILFIYSYSYYWVMSQYAQALQTPPPLYLSPVKLIRKRTENQKLCRVVLAAPAPAETSQPTATPNNNYTSQHSWYAPSPKVKIILQLHSITREYIIQNYLTLNNLIFITYLFYHYENCSLGSIAFCPVCSLFAKP